jgi:glycosyltransferase involved in cell wall biosynthesis
VKICHIITRLIIGGAQENTVLTCRGLAERGHDVTLISGPETGPEGSLWDVARNASFQAITLDSLRRAVNPWHDYQALRDLTTILRRLAPDVVHTHSSKAGILGRFAARRAGVPQIVHTIHGMSFNRTQSWPLRLLYRELETWAARYTDTLVSVADAMSLQAIDAGVAHSSKFHTIRSGMETNTFGPDPAAAAVVRGEWNMAPGDLVIGTVARLFDNKGYDEIIAAVPRIVRQVPAARFVWVGDGARRPEYEERLRALGMRERVHIVGLVAPAVIPRLIRGFDILVHASRWEGLPRAIVQSMLTEVPVVSFDNDGAPEVVADGETGVLVPLGDAAGLANGVIKLAGDEALRQSMGSRGRARCLAAFDWHKMVADLEALYQGRAAAAE